MAQDLRKPVDIEQLVRWTYRDELPKRASFLHEEMSPMFAFADLGTRVDVTHEPGFPAALGEPHPDALHVSDAVDQLTDKGINWAETREDILPDLWRWVALDDPIVSSMQFQSRQMVIDFARLGTRPIWDLGPTRVVRVNAANGKPRVQFVSQDLETEGEVMFGLTAGGRYGHMAHCALRIEPDAREIACARAEYWVWRAALFEVKLILERDGKLKDHRPLAPAAAREPWMRDSEPKSKILPSLSRVCAVV